MDQCLGIKKKVTYGALILYQVATDLVQEQCGADANTSIQQRVLMGVGTAIQGTAGALCDEGEGNQDMMIAGGTML